MVTCGRPKTLPIVEALQNYISCGNFLVGGGREFLVNTLQGTLVLVSMEVATRGALATMGTIGSTQTCPIFVLLAPRGLNRLCRQGKLSKGSAVLGSPIQIGSRSSQRFVLSL